MDYNLGQSFWKTQPRRDQVFFEAAKDYFAENYGEQNIAYASVHMDESTPHMHLGIVPMQDGKLSSKAMFDREELKKDTGRVAPIHERARFWARARARNSEAKHLTVAEFKQEIAYKEIEQELVLDFGAPEYANNLGEFVTKRNIKEVYEVFKMN